MRDDETWTGLRVLCERAARDAGLARARGDRAAARALHARAASLAERALDLCGEGCPRTFAATAADAAGHWLRAGDAVALVGLAGRVLARPDLLAYARCEVEAALAQCLGPRPALLH